MPDAQTILGELRQRGVSRRDFVKFCGVMAGALALPGRAAGEIAEALATVKKPALVWLQFQSCGGDTASLLRASRPTVADIFLDVLSVDYHPTLMAAAGTNATALLHGDAIAVVEGSIPTADGGVYCMIGGRTAQQIVKEVCGRAAATIAVGNCAAFGGLSAAKPNPTGAVSVADAVPGIRNLINLPQCPANVENLTATIVHYLTFRSWPDLDARKRPLFAYGQLVHDNCQRRAHFDASHFAEQWGGEGHRAGYCLYKLGCKGPVAFSNCPSVRWNGGTSWAVEAGHPCLGCSEAGFWDKNTPFYRHVDDGVHANIDTVGAAAVGVLAAGLAARSVVAVVRRAKREDES